MKTRGILILVTFILLLSAASLCVLSFRERRALETARQELAARRSALQAGLKRQAEQQARSERMTRETAQASATRANPASPSSKAQAPKKQLFKVEEWLKDPKNHALYSASKRAYYEKCYGVFFRTQSLAPEAREKLVRLLISAEDANVDVLVIAKDKGVDKGDPAIDSLVKQAQDDLRKGEMELLGSAGYAQLREYERTLKVREPISNFAGQAAVEGMPIDVQQAEQLARIMANTSTSYQGGGRADLSQVDWKAVEAQAAGVLSPEQLDLFRSELGGPGSEVLGVQLAKLVRKIGAEGAAIGGK